MNVEKIDAKQSTLQKEDYFNTDGFERMAPLLVQSASSIRKAFGNCWIQASHTTNRWGGSDYKISIQPNISLTPNDVQLVLSSLGYSVTFKSISNGKHAKWVYFEVQARCEHDVRLPCNGLTFELSSTVSSIEQPELERYDEPASDEELISV